MTWTSKETDFVPHRDPWVAHSYGLPGRAVTPTRPVPREPVWTDVVRT